MNVTKAGLGIEFALGDGFFLRKLDGGCVHACGRNVPSGGVHCMCAKYMVCMYLCMPAVAEAVAALHRWYGSCARPQPLPSTPRSLAYLPRPTTTCVFCCTGADP